MVWSSLSISSDPERRMWCRSLSLWYSSLFFLWWPLTRSRYQLLKEKKFSRFLQRNWSEWLHRFSTTLVHNLCWVSYVCLGNLLRGKNSIDSPQNSPHRCCCSVTHTDGAAPFSSFSVLTCTLVMFSEHLPWAFSLTQWGKFTPQRGCSSVSVHPGRYFCVDYIWWTSAKSSLESLSLKSCCLQLRICCSFLFLLSPTAPSSVWAVNKRTG